MIKQIEITYNGVTYKLGFNRQTVAIMEKQGFDITQIDHKPMSVLDLFAGAFLLNHRAVKRQVIEEIYDNLSDKQGLFTKLAELYTEPILSLLDEKPDEGNASWTASW